MSPSFPFVSVVVAALDPEGLEECLTSLSAMHYPATQREIIVASGDPYGRTEPIAREHGAVHLAAGSRSITAARNRGIGVSSGEIVAFTDPDCVVTSQWLRILVKPFTDAGVGAVAGSILPYPPRTSAERYMARRRSHSQERPLAHRSRPFAMTPNLAFRRQVFESIGLFDIRFPGGGWEDADLCWRFREGTRWRIAYAPRAAVFHRYRETTWSFLVQQYRYGYGLGVLLQKYRSEVPQEWAKRAGSFRGLGAALASLGIAILHPARWGADRQDLAFRSFEVLRELCQRSGYWTASIVRR